MKYLLLVVMTSIFLTPVTHGSPSLIRRASATLYNRAALGHHFHKDRLFSSRKMARHQDPFAAAVLLLTIGYIPYQLGKGIFSIIREPIGDLEEGADPLEHQLDEEDWKLIKMISTSNS